MSWDLTVDVCVLMSGSGTGNPESREHSFLLMTRMESERSFSLALDERQKIQQQYLRKLPHGNFGHEWFIRMVSKGKTKVVPWTHIDRGTLTGLKEAHFDSGVGEDFKYVVTAAGTDCRVLVSHDPDYSAPVRRILRKRLGVTVETAEAAAERGKGKGTF